MKLKFRADKKDFVIFAICFVVISYILAITVINLYGAFRPGFEFTLNPIPSSFEILLFVIIAIITFFHILHKVHLLGLLQLHFHHDVLVF